VGGDDKDWQSVTLNPSTNHSKIISIAATSNSTSTLKGKKRRAGESEGTALALHSKLISGGEKGIHDPKGLLAKLKSKKRKQKKSS
jgi:hypothetical protein